MLSSIGVSTASSLFVQSFPTTCPLLRFSPSRNNVNPDTPRLRNHTPTQSLQTQSTQPPFPLFYPRNFMHMLQADLPYGLLTRLHRPFQFALAFFDPRGLEEKVGGGWCTDLKVKGSVWADGYAAGDRGSEVVV